MTIEREFCEGGLVSATALVCEKALRKPRAPLANVNRKIAAYLQTIAASDACLARIARGPASMERHSHFSEQAIRLQEQAAEVSRLARQAAGVDE